MEMQSSSRGDGDDKESQAKSGCDEAQQMYYDHEQQRHPSRPSRAKQVRFTNIPTSPPAIRDYYGGQSLNPRAVTAAAATTTSPHSPLMKRFAPVQDRRVNTILLEALQLVEFTKEELFVVEKSIKRLRDAIHGFAILVDKQVNIIGAESLEERGRVKADIQDLCENLKTSNALFDSTCARMKKHLHTGKNQIHAHKRKFVGKVVAELVDTATAAESCAAHQCSVNDAIYNSGSPSRGVCHNQALYGINVGPHSQAPGGSPSSPVRPSTSSGSSSPGRQPVTSAMATPTGSGSVSPLMSRMRSPSRVPLAAVMEPSPPDEYAQREPQVYLSPDFFESVSETVGICDKEFFEPKDLVRFVHEMLTFSIARSGVLTFMGKAHHRQLIPKYANELVRLVLQEFQPASQSLSSTTPPVVVPQNTFFDYMCTEPFRFNQLLHGLYVANCSPSDGTSYFTAAAAFVVDPIDPLTGVGTNPFAEQFTRNGGVLNGGKVVNLVVAKPTESEMLETAEQTLSIAKLMHDLATAESEAKYGNRLSIRPPASRSKEFSKAYIATSKELMLKETGLG